MDLLLPASRPPGTWRELVQGLFVGFHRAFEFEAGRPVARSWFDGLEGDGAPSGARRAISR